MTYRIGVGGIAIESSTFSPLPSTLVDFTILRGDELLTRYPFIANNEHSRSECAGVRGMPGRGWQFLQDGRARGDVTWLPCLHARAIPGGPVTGEAYAAMKGELLERIQAALPLDGFYLDVHGAMYVQGMEDAEADLTAAIRELVGPDCLISGSF